MKFNKAEKKVLLTLATTTYFSGLFLFILNQWIRVDSAIGKQHHPAEYWARIFHFIFTYGIVLVVGYLIKGHVIPGLKSKHKKRIRSGVLILILFFALVGTALGAMYAGDLERSTLVGLIHAMIGLSCPFVVLLHLYSKK